MNTILYREMPAKCLFVCLFVFTSLVQLSLPVEPEKKKRVVKKSLDNTIYKNYSLICN